MTKLIPGKLYSFDGDADAWEIFYCNKHKYDDGLYVVKPLVFLKIEKVNEDIASYLFLYKKNLMYGRVSKKYYKDFEDLFEEII